MTKSSTSPARRTRRDRTVPPLSDLDVRILTLLSRHRVLTQSQLAQIVAESPIRTLRYRCARLVRHRLAGRSRPYRERGSAPHHFWPTRRGEAILTGGPPPRGGERREPNPLFLGHAAALSDLYVGLATGLPTGIELARFEREGEAREPFAGPAREARAVAPDAYVELADTDGRTLSALVELDMGTMSHRRLKTKAAGYAEYARANAWRERHRFCPALLFITTTEKRARSFLTSMLKELGPDAQLLTCVCDLARRRTHIPTEPRWLLSGDEGEGAVNLLAALREARRPYDEDVARWEAWRRDREAETKRLRADPEALRDHLRSRPGHVRDLDRLGRLSAEALRITLGADGPLTGTERGALLALGALLADPIEIDFGDREPSAAERRALDDLIDFHRADQLRRVDDLAGRLGVGPALRRVRDRLESGDLLDSSDASGLALRAQDDRKARVEQERLRSVYLAWREGEARRLAKGQGLAARLRRRPDDFLEEVDRRSLRVCRDCREVVYPEPERTRYQRQRPDVASRCHFCGRGDLADYEPPSG